MQSHLLLCSCKASTLNGISEGQKRRQVWRKEGGNANEAQAISCRSDPDPKRFPCLLQGRFSHHADVLNRELRLVVLHSPANGEEYRSRRAQGQSEDGLDGLRQSVALRLFGAALVEKQSRYRCPPTEVLLLGRLLRLLREAVSVGIAGASSIDAAACCGSPDFHHDGHL